MSEPRRTTSGPPSRLTSPSVFTRLAPLGIAAIVLTGFVVVNGARNDFDFAGRANWVVWSALGIAAFLAVVMLMVSYISGERLRAITKLRPDAFVFVAGDTPDLASTLRAGASSGLFSMERTPGPRLSIAADSSSITVYAERPLRESIVLDWSSITDISDGFGNVGPWKTSTGPTVEFRVVKGDAEALIILSSATGALPPTVSPSESFWIAARLREIAETSRE